MIFSVLIGVKDQISETANATMRATSPSLFANTDFLRRPPSLTVGRQIFALAVHF